KYFKLRDKKQKPADFLRYKSKDGFLMMVGRNNTQNDKLTMKTARGCDLWFHTKIAPGSHVIVVADGNEIPDSTKNEAAQLALYHSSVSGGSKVAIDYT
ncbi:MAG: NFACT RNA binding domain-containing protein, partial [Oscillospiraceae bacterium]